MKINLKNNIYKHENAFESLYNENKYRFFKINENNIFKIKENIKINHFSKKKKIETFSTENFKIKENMKINHFSKK